jgi:hypothetical protein
MVLGGDDHLDADRWYEIGLDGGVSDAVRRAHPAAQVRSAGTSTILWSRLHRPDDLDLLLEALADFGLTPREVHESAGRTRAGRRPGTDPGGPASDSLPYCEVRIAGLLGQAALHHLGWSHRVVRTTVVRLWASHRSLRAALAQMATVTGVDYVLAIRTLRPEPG